MLVAERVREAFETSGVVVDEGPVDTTVSIGVAGGPAGTELEVLLASADTALYQAKRGGRNRVEAAEELPLSLENWRRQSARAGRRSRRRVPATGLRREGSLAVILCLPFDPYHCGHGIDPSTEPASCPDVARSRCGLGTRRLRLPVLDRRTNTRRALITRAPRPGALRAARRSYWPLALFVGCALIVAGTVLLLA